MTAFLLALLLAAGYWETKPPADWTDIEISQLLADSPWSHPLTADHAAFPPVQAYLASARPIQQAEQERDRRAKAKAKGAAENFDPFADEYRAWLEDNSKTHIVLAIRVNNTKAFSDSKELKALEASVMRVGRKRIPMTGYFPPSLSDPYLRIAFPRQVQLSDKQVQFDLYVPGVSGPARLAEFKLEPMVVAGKLEL